MNDLYIEPSEFIPEVSFKSAENSFKIIFQKGQSHAYMPDFLQPIKDWLINYLQNPSIEKISLILYADKATFENLKPVFAELIRHPKIDFKRVEYGY